VAEVLPELYLHGLSEGDFDLALRGLLGEGAPLSASSIARLKQKWQAEFDEWKSRSLLDKEVVYLWVDGVYVKAGLQKRKAAMLVAVAGLRDGTKEVIAIEPGHRESTESWSAVLRDLKKRGMNCPKLVIGDGHLGIWGALANVFPDAEEQRCWNHRILNILDKINKTEHRQAKLILTAIPYAETQRQAEALKKKFQDWCRGKDFHAAADLIECDWDRMITFYSFPKEHWKHLRTTNVVESPFAAVRLRTTAAKRYMRVDNATAVIWKVLMLAEKRFRKLNASELLPQVAEGAAYADGIRVKNSEVKNERKVSA
jgi:transposase-like protein